MLDRSFLYGDAVYEVWRTAAGVIFAFEEHLFRLPANGVILRLKAAFSACMNDYAGAHPEFRVA